MTTLVIYVQSLRHHPSCNGQQLCVTIPALPIGWLLEFHCFLLECYLHRHTGVLAIVHQVLFFILELREIEILALVLIIRLISVEGRLKVQSHFEFGIEDTMCVHGVVGISSNSAYSPVIKEPCIKQTVVCNL